MENRVGDAFRAAGGNISAEESGYASSFKSIQSFQSTASFLGTPCSKGELVTQCDGGDGTRELLRQALTLFEPKDAGEQDKPLPEFRTDIASWFDVVIITLVVLNTLAMAMEHFDGAVPVVTVPHTAEDNCCDALCEVRSPEDCPRGIRTMDEGWMLAYEVMDGCFDAAFLLELILRLTAAWSFRRYFCENFPFQAMDFNIVSTSSALFVIELFLPKVFNVAIFRIFRVGRVFRLISKFRRLRLLVAKAVRSFVNILHVLFVMVFWHFLCAILGLQLFNCEVRDEAVCGMLESGQCPEECSFEVAGECVFSDAQVYERCPWDEYWNFNTLPAGLILLIFVTTGENWTEQLASGMRSNPSPIPGLLFFAIFYVVSFYMLLNLFTGVILEEFELTDHDREALQLGAFRVALVKKMRQANLIVKEEHSRGNSSEEGEGRTSTGMAVSRRPSIERVSTETTRVSTGMSQNNPQTERANIEGEQVSSLERLRRGLQAIVEHPRFDHFMMLAICVSTLLLALESPIKEYAVIRPDDAFIVDIFFFSVFCLECILKVMNLGVIREKTAYFRSTSNLFDFTVLLLQGLDLVGINGLKSLRSFRVLRPLRLLSRLESLQLLISSMQGALPDIASVVILWLCACVGFSICAIQIFAGMLWRCNDWDFVGPDFNPGELEGSGVGWRENCAGNYFPFESNAGAYVSDANPTFIMKPRVWSNPVDGASGVGWHFDNFAWAFQTLYEVSTFELWSDVVFSTTDITGHGQQPMTYSSPANALFFHAWIIISCFFLLQLVIGVLIEAINRKSGVSLLTDDQRNFKFTQERIRMMKPDPPEWKPTHSYRLACYNLVNSNYFQHGITTLVGVNVAIMTSESYDQNESWGAAIETLNVIFLTFYLVEAALKLYAYLHRYFLDSWNLFDLFVVLASLVELAASSAGVGLQALRALRIIKVVRALRLVRRVKRFFLLCRSFAAAMPRVRSTTVLLLLFIFVFALFGVQLFAGVRFGTGIHQLNNFRTTLEGMITLVRVMTGENWQTTMHDCQIMAPLCTTNEEAQEIFGDPDAVGDCGSFFGGLLFFDIFFFVSNNILFNLFVAVLLDNFFSFHGQDKFVLTSSLMDNYQQTWKELDPEGTGMLPLSALRTLVTRLHAKGNFLGTTVASEELRFRLVLIEAASRPNKPEASRVEKPQLHFSHLLEVLALHCVGPNVLPYKDMLVRQEMLVHYAKLAVASKLTSLRRGVSQSYGEGEASGKQDARFQTRLRMELRRMRAMARGDDSEGEAEASVQSETSPLDLEAVDEEDSLMASRTGPLRIGSGPPRLEIGPPRDQSDPPREQTGPPWDEAEVERVSKVLADAQEWRVREV